jgi:hypothetical protein
MHHTLHAHKRYPFITASALLPDQPSPCEGSKPKQARAEQRHRCWFRRDPAAVTVPLRNIVESEPMTSATASSDRRGSPFAVIFSGVGLPAFLLGVLAKRGAGRGFLMVNSWWIAGKSW